MICINIKDVMDIFAERLVELVNEKYSTLKEFAIDINIPYTTINSWTLKKRCPTIYYLKLIADHFKVSADYLLGREN